MKLVVVAQPRSCSTWLMNQLRTSPHLHVHEDTFGELLTPGFRYHTRSLLGLPATDNPETWLHDAMYAELFWKMNPDGCFKVLAHANGAQFYHYLMTIPDMKFATIQRSDTASALASEIACMIKHRQQGDKMSFKVPARTHTVRYQDIDNFVFNTPDWKRARILEFFYYLLEGKGQRWLTRFGDQPNCLANIVDTDIEALHALEYYTGSTFDMDSLKPQSHYSEIFEDWEVYERDINNILGIT